MTTLDLFGPSPRDLAVDALHAATAIYTMPPVVDDLLDNLDWPRGQRRLVDPSCGDGIFLSRAVERLFLAEPGISDDRLASLVEGWEIHPQAAASARARVAATLTRHGRGITQAAEIAARMVHAADFLVSGPDRPTYHVIAGNPPYLRFHGVLEPLRTEYRAVLPKYACNDLLHSFLSRCAEAIFPDGEIALVTADRWLTNVGAAGLRAVLGQNLAIDHLERLDAASAFYRPKQRRAGSPPRIHPISVILRRPGEQSIQLSDAPVYPGATIAGVPGGATLGSIADVRLAPWLGTAGVFVVDAETAAGLPPEYLVPAVDTDDIVDGELQQPKRFAIRTFPDREPPPAIMAHLQSNLHRMAARGRLRKQTWLPPETFHRMSLDRPALLIPRIARSLRPTRLPSGLVAINHNLSIVAEGSASLDDLDALLSSAEANQWVRERAAPLEGGFYSLTTKLLRELPIAFGTLVPRSAESRPESGLTGDVDDHPRS